MRHHFFGGSMIMNDSLMVIGTTTGEIHRDYRMKVYIYHKKGEWKNATEDARLIPEQKNWLDGFGYSIALNHEYIAVGAPGYPGVISGPASVQSTGAVYIFQKPVHGWTGTISEAVQLLPADPSDFTYFGQSLAMNESDLYVGAPHSVLLANRVDFLSNDDNRIKPGAVYHYRKPANGWKSMPVQHRKYFSEGPDWLDGFGSALLFHENQLYVSAVLDDTRAGSESGSVQVMQQRLDVNPLLTITSPDSAFCAAGRMTLSATVIPQTSYTWYLPQGTTLASPATGNQIDFDMTSAANQRAVFVSISDGCVQYFSDPYTLKISSRPANPQFINAASIVCAGTSKSYTINVVDADEIVWTMPSGISATIDSQSSSRLLHFAESFLQDDIIVTAKNQCGESSSSLHISTYPTPAKPILAGTEMICSSVTDLQKSISPVVGAGSYEWVLPQFITQNPGYPQHTNTLNARIASQFESGEIRVRAIGQCIPGELSEPFTISRKPGPSAATRLTGPDQICTSSGDVAYNIPAVANATRYVWDVSGPFAPNGKIINATNSLQLKPTGKGTGFITVHAMNECGDEGGSVRIYTTSFEPLLTPKAEKNLCENEITVTQADTVQWFKNGVLLPNFHETTISVFDPGTYTVRVSNFCGEAESEPVEVDPVIEREAVFPNVITPNGDGKNDFFELDRTLENSSLSITNRWGMEIYKSQNYLGQWNAQDISSGTYFYILQNECLSKPYRGWIQVLKE